METRPFHKKTAWRMESIRQAVSSVLFEFIDDFIEPGALSFVLRAVLSHEVGVVQEGFFLLFLQALWYGDFDFHVQIALPAGLEVRHAFADDAEAGCQERRPGR